MYQWRLMDNKKEFEYGRNMAKQMGLEFVKDIDLNLLKLPHPSIYIGNEDCLKFALGVKLDLAIELLKQDRTKGYFEFNGLMYCKLYPSYRSVPNIIVVMDLYLHNVLS